MTKLTSLYITLSRLAEDERGQDLVEYSLLAGLIALSFGAFNTLGAATSISKLFSKMGSTISLAAV